MVIAARDEQARIEATIGHLLAQRGVEADIIAVDDRSTDQTSKILQRLAKEDPRVQVERVEVLPEGWLGKCHACHVGARAATGDWIVFCALIAGLTAGTLAGLAAGLSPLSLILPAGILARRLGWSWPCAIGMPFMFPVFLYALLNSTWVTVRQGGIRWRETFYPLGALRAGTVR